MRKVFKRNQIHSFNKSGSLHGRRRPFHLYLLVLHTTAIIVGFIFGVANIRIDRALVKDIDVKGTG